MFAEGHVFAGRYAGSLRQTACLPCARFWAYGKRISSRQIAVSRSDPSYSLDAQLCVHLQTYFEQLKELGVHHCLLLHKKECYYFFSLDLKLC
jgi:hypothetical protein